jgi:hypothetical protein
VTILKCYRQQKHNLIRVIKQEGGLYYIAALGRPPFIVLGALMIDRQGASF